MNSLVGQPMNTKIDSMSFLLVIISLSLLLSPVAVFGITFEQQQKLQEYFDTNGKMVGFSKQVIDEVTSENSTLLGNYADALLVLDLANKFANAQDKQLLETISTEVGKKALEKSIPNLSAALNWLSWAKTGLELLDQFVVNPARIGSSLDDYFNKREAGWEPEDAIVAVRDWGNVLWNLKKEFRKQYGDAAFKEIRPSTLTLLPRWDKKFNTFVAAFFESEYIKYKVRKEAAKIQQTKSAEIKRKEIRLIELLRKKEKKLARKNKCNNSQEDCTEESRTKQGADYNEGLDSLIERVRQMRLSGANRRRIAEWLTKQVDNRIFNRDDPAEFFGGPAQWLQQLQKGKEGKKSLQGEELARQAWRDRFGSSEENANITYVVLKRAGMGGNIRIITIGNSHVFTVWGMADGANPNDPHTWGSDALAVDSWYGGVLTPEEVMMSPWFKNNNPDTHIADTTTDYDKSAVPWQVSEVNRPRKPEEDIGDCFIATAVYGTPLAKEIQVLRDFRDNELRHHFFGRWFIHAYETYGPFAAEWLRRHKQYKAPVREKMIDPLVTYLQEGK